VAETKTVNCHRPASMALDGFSPRVQQTIRQAVRMIRGPRSASDGTPEVARLPIPEPMYVLRATPEICVMFKLQTSVS